MQDTRINVADRSFRRTLYARCSPSRTFYNNIIDHLRLLITSAYHREYIASIDNAHNTSLLAVTRKGVSAASILLCCLTLERRNIIDICIERISSSRSQRCFRLYVFNDYTPCLVTSSKLRKVAKHKIFCSLSASLNLRYSFELIMNLVASIMHLSHFTIQIL